jgi:hypothetical protein
MLKGRRLAPIEFYEAGRKSLHSVGYEGMAIIRERQVGVRVSGGIRPAETTLIVPFTHSIPGGWWFAPLKFETD